MNTEYLKIAIWAAVIGGVLAFLSKKGYLVKIRDYFFETKEELRKCAWPSITELKGSTTVVMITIALIGGFTVGVDWLLTMFMRVINS